MKTNSKTTFLHLLFVAALLGVSLGGCKDDSTGKGQPFDPGEVVPTERTAKSIASQSGCAIDQDCVAGLYCFQGLCAYDCTTAAECALGEVCSPRGVCTVAAPQPPSTLNKKGAAIEKRDATGDTEGVDTGHSTDVSQLPPGSMNDEQAGIQVTNIPNTTFLIKKGQTEVVMTIQLSAQPIGGEIRYTLDRTDEVVAEGQLPPANKVYRQGVVAQEGGGVVNIPIPVGSASPDLPNATSVSMVLTSSVGSYKLALNPEQPFAGNYAGKARVSVFGNVGLPMELKVVTSPDTASLAEATDAWLLLDISDGNLFSPVDVYDGAPEYLSTPLVYDAFLQRWVAIFDNEFVLGDSALTNRSEVGQIGRTLRFEIEPFENDKIIGSFSDRWAGFYDARSDSGIVESVDVLFEGELELTRVGAAPMFAEMLPPLDLPSANPGLIPLPPTDTCSSEVTFPEECVDADISTNTLFQNAANEDQIICALAMADTALAGMTTGSMLSAFLDDSVENPGGMSFADFMEACALGTDGICVPSPETVCSRELLAYAFQNQPDDSAQSGDIVVAYQSISREAFLGRQLAAFKTDTDSRLKWLKTSDYPAIVTNAVKDLISGLLDAWQAGVLDVHMGVLGGYYDASGLAILTRGTSDEAATEARKQLFSEMIQAWRASAEALSLAAARWDQLYQETAPRVQKSVYVTSQMFDLYLMAGILTNLTKDSGSGYQATAFGNGFSHLMRRAGMLSLSFDDKVFARDAEVVVSTSVAPGSQEEENASLLINLQTEAEMEIARAGQSVQTVLAEAEETALNETQLTNKMNNEINDLRTELVNLCGLPVGCTTADFRDNEECRVLPSAGECGFQIARGTGDMLAWDPSAVGVSEAGQALLEFMDAANSMKLANEDLRAFNARMTLELASLEAFAAEIERWNELRGAGLTALTTLFDAQGEFGSASMDALESTLTQKATIRADKIERMKSNLKLWRGIRIAGAAVDFAGETAAAIAHQTGDNLEATAEAAKDFAEAAAEGLPKAVGVSPDATAPARAAMRMSGAMTNYGMKIGAVVAHSIGTGLEIATNLERSLREASLTELQEEAAKDDAISDDDITALEEELELAIARNDDAAGGLQEIYEQAKLQRENELAYFRDMEEFERRRRDYLQMLEDSAGFSLRVEHARINYQQRMNGYLQVVQTAELQYGRLVDLEGQRADVNRLVGSPGVVFASANKLAQAETRLQRAKDKLMDWLVGLEYFAVRPFMDQRVQILLAVNPYQLEDIAEELKRLESRCGGAQNQDTATISIRTGLMNVTSPIVDETTNIQLTAEQRFIKILKDGYVPIDKRVRYTTDSTVGDLIKSGTGILSATFDIGLSDFANLASTCNAKVISVAAQLVGDIGDARPTITILYDGTSQLRSCQPGITDYVELIGEDLTNFGEITMLRTPGRSISPLAGINSWRAEAAANATLGGLPLASQYTVLINTKIGENALLNWDNLEDILLNVTYSYQDIFPVGQCE